jgi:serine/threonine-protein kinase
LEERIAAGGVGQVWRALDLLLERPVAVKVLRPEYADHPETLDRFRNEARHAGAVSHPGIAQVYDYGDWSAAGPPFLVLEFVEGPSLAGLIAAGPVDPVLALDVIAQAAAGLDAAHRAGLVHRDVKPGNILIGPAGRVKITDFGIAHAAGQAPITGPGLVMGTSHYMAPERIIGGGGGPASDLYALGIVLHECLTGRHPYGGSAAEVMAAHLYLPLPELPAGLPRTLAEFVARLTAKDPAQRLVDAGAVAAQAAGLRDALRDGAIRRPQARPTVSQAAAVSSAPAGPLAEQPDERTAAPAHPDGNGSQSARAPAGGGQVSLPTRRPAEMATRPAAGGRHARDRRRSTALAAAAAALLTGACLAWLLASGVFQRGQTGDVAHGAPTADGTAAGRVPSSGASGTGTSTSAGQHGGPAGTGNGGTPVSSGTPTGSTDTGPSPSGSNAPSTSPSSAPTGSPDPSASATPSSPTGTPVPDPSPTPGGTGPSLPVPLPSVTLSL